MICKAYGILGLSQGPSTGLFIRPVSNGVEPVFYQSAIVVGGGFKNDVKNPFVHGTSFEDEMWIFTWVICVRDKKTARSSK